MERHFHTSLHQNQARVGSERKEGVTAWQAQPVLKTEQFERKDGVGGDVSMLMLKCTGLNLSQVDVQTALTLAYGSQSQRRPPPC